MRRTLVAAALPAAVVAAMWLRLESPRGDPTRAAVVVVLAVAPALAAGRRARLAAAAVSLLLGTRAAFGVWPRHPGRVWSISTNGFLDFYGNQVPFDPRVHAEMHSMILAAVFAFVLLLGIAVALRRPLVAVLVVLVGAGWPATLSGPAHGLEAGAAILLAVLGVLGSLTSRRVPRLALPVAICLAVAAVAASSSSAVARGELVAWQGWHAAGAPVTPVSVSYVWDAQYDGLQFPPTRTTVLEIKAPPRALYWRAAVLDRFAADRWLEAPLRAGDLLQPPGARDRANWVRQDVTVKALEDTHLVGAATQEAYDAGEAPIARARTGGPFLPGGLTRGLQYTVWSDAPQPSPSELDHSLPRYPASLTRRGTFLDVWPGVTVPPFGSLHRTRRLTALLDIHPEVARYLPLEKTALALAQRARTPYGAAISFESWFRTRGGFTYSGRPAVFADAPLVGFVVQTRAGYCQYFAGAMALMLRYAGVPARVAVGFASGTYDARRGVWTVTDHEAHAWVEAWFRGYGWLPFDPTPSAGRPERGRLDAAYSASSPRFTLGATGIALPSGPAVPSQAAHRHGEAGPTGGGGIPGAGAPAARPPGHGSLLVLLGLAAAALLAGVALAKLVARRARYLSRDPRRVAAACRHELADYLLDQRIDAVRSATLHELGGILRAELAVDPDRFVAAATAARFGPPAGARPAARDARRELRALMRAVRHRLTARERLRGLLSLRSLGLAP